MRKIVAGLFMSLDGVVESPEQWQFPYFNDEMGQALGSSMAASDTLLLGRRTYQEFAATWPGRGSDDPTTRPPGRQDLWHGRAVAYVHTRVTA